MRGFLLYVLCSFSELIYLETGKNVEKNGINVKKTEYEKKKEKMRKK